VPSPSQFAGCIADYFSKNQARTAQVLAGPNRETGSAQRVFVALCRATKAMAGDELVPDSLIAANSSYLTIFKWIEGVKMQSQLSQRLHNHR
jgi:hypothetical protein